MIKGVPRGIRRQVLETFVAALQSNPVLSNNRVIKTWLIWDGSASIAETSVAMMPACQVRMLGGPVTRECGSRQPGKPMSYINKSILTIVIDLATAGTDQSDLSDISDLIYAALAPQDTVERIALQARFLKAGIHDWQLTREIQPASAEAFSLEAVSGMGSYQLTLFTNS